MNPNHQIATLAGGCFWCLEAVFDELNGVISVESGYSGGHVENPILPSRLQRGHGSRGSGAGHLRPVACFRTATC